MKSQGYFVSISTKICSYKKSRNDKIYFEVSINIKIIMSKTNQADQLFHERILSINYLMYKHAFANFLPEVNF